jgi:hypothetical protein
MLAFTKFSETNAIVGPPRMERGSGPRVAAASETLICTPAGSLTGPSTTRLVGTLKLS